MKKCLLLGMLLLILSASAMDSSNCNNENDEFKLVQATYEQLQEIINKKFQAIDSQLDTFPTYCTDPEQAAARNVLAEQRTVIFFNNFNEKLVNNNGVITLKKSIGLTQNPIAKLIGLMEIQEDNKQGLVAAFSESELLPFIEFFIHHKIGTQKLDYIASPSICLSLAVAKMLPATVELLIKSGFLNPQEKEYSLTTLERAEYFLQKAQQIAHERQAQWERSTQLNNFPQIYQEKIRRYKQIVLYLKFLRSNY